ncbi:MAG: hypothetical protein KBG92_02805 [Spirochaetes bacterium]|mgnify:CR=1 FL=1|nr:hypothetical protein [Spirochaetota bacterium]HQL43482.1 hypothetical protein [Spirochaetota bacterium]
MKLCHYIAILILSFTSCKGLDIQTVCMGSLNNDAIYIKNVRIHHEGFIDIKDALASNIVFCLQQHNFKAASYFNAPNSESEYRYFATVDLFITTTGDILNPIQNLSLYISINEASTQVATIQIISQTYDIRRSDDQLAIAQAIALKIDDMVQKK